MPRNPGEALSSVAQRKLLEKGFEPGYPVYVGERLDVSTQLQILRLITTEQMIRPDELPILYYGLCLPPGGRKSQAHADGTEMDRVSVRMLMGDICRSYEGGSNLYWYLRGEWRPKERKHCFVDRKSVSTWIVRVRIDYDAIVQFVPKGFRGENLLAPDGDDFRWGTRSAKALPPPYRKK